MLSEAARDRVAESKHPYPLPKSGTPPRQCDIHHSHTRPHPGTIP